MKYMLGCNYWDSESGTEMWANWRPDVVEDDLRVLSQYGVEYLRVFPLWRDFQPVHTVYGWQNEFHEYRLHGKELPKDEFFLDEDCMQHFADFLKMGEKYGIKFIVSIVTGWMSGTMYAPPAVLGKNYIEDPECLMLEIKFVKGFVRRFKDSKQIAYWEIGNESNCLAPATKHGSAYLWTSTIVNAIKSEDNTRKIMSGMHAISPHHSIAGIDGAGWTIQDQGEICDILTPHPYPSRTVGGEKDPLNMPRTTYIPSAQMEYYGCIGKRPAMISESGTFNKMVGKGDFSADFMRVSVLSGWANGSLGYLWWCAHEHSHITYPPYSWSMIERELGLLYRDKSPKPVALEMKRLQDVLSSMPFEELPKKEYDCYCISTFSGNWWGIADTTYQLSKQAGFNTGFTWCEQALPDARLYIVPSISGWACMPFETFETLFKKVEQGANLLFTCGSGFISEFEHNIGLESYGMQNNTGLTKVKFGDTELDIKYGTEFKLKSIGAEVLAEDANGNVVFSRKKQGKGYVYFLNFPLEEMLWEGEEYLRDAEKYPYYKIYQTFAKEVIDSKLVTSPVPDVGITEHKLSDNEYVIVAINYTDHTVDPALSIKASRVETLYGNVNSIPKCDMTVLKITL